MKLEDYIEQTPENIRKDIINICKIQDKEQRWQMIKVCFLAYAPELVDNHFAWNLYRETI